MTRFYQSNLKPRRRRKSSRGAKSIKGGTTAILKIFSSLGSYLNPRTVRYKGGSMTRGISRASRATATDPRLAHARKGIGRRRKKS